MDFDLSRLKHIYTRYGTIMLGNIFIKFGSYGNDIRLKIYHGISMSESVPQIMRQTGLFHESYDSSAAVDGLFHDIGRFAQYFLTGNLQDYNLEKDFGLKDHGRLGEQVVEEFDYYFSEYFPILKAVIGNHTCIYRSEYNCDLSKIPPIFQEYSLEEIMKKGCFLDYLIGSKIKLVQEADNFELIQNVVSKRWISTISSEKKDFITREAWELFCNNQPLMISEMRKNNCWSINSGVLLRFGLIPQKAQLRSTLEVLLEQGYLKKMYEMIVSDDPLIMEGYKYATLLVQNMIQLSEAIITKQSRDEAVQLTKKMWK